MECFNNLIGIKTGCNDIDSISGLYINQLSGISVDTANSAVDKEYLSGVDLIKDKITFATLAVENAVRATIQDKLKIKSVVTNDTIGYFKENNQQSTIQAGYLKGIRIKIDQYKYFSFNLNSIKFRADITGAVNVFVYDLLTGNLLDTYTADSTANQYTTVIVNKRYFVSNQRLQLGIFMDSEVANFHATDLYKSSGCYSCNNSNYSNKFVYFNGVKIDKNDAKIYNNTQTITGTAGISIDYSIECAIEPFICSMANVLAWPILHKAGAELMKEFTYSKRLNSVIVIDRGDHKELMEMFENEYMSSLKALLENIVIPNDYCFDCNSKLKTTIQIP